ncbi:MAG: TonB-dependent receptor, partial [Parahaliea sp.]
SPMALTFQLFDIERVEVLKGPQGTLYGRNTTGGAVKFISSQPGDSVEANLRVGVGNYHRRELEGALSGPVSENVGARIAWTYNKADGFHKNRHTGNRMADTDTQAGRLLLDWQPHGSFSAQLNLHGGKTDTTNVPFEHSGRLDTGGNPCNPLESRCVDALGYRDADGDPYQHDIDFEGHTRIRNFGGSLNLSVDLEDLHLVSITAYDDSRRDHQEDADASPNNVLNTYWDDDNEQFSQEIRLISNSDDLNWILGAFYSSESNAISNQYDFFRGFRDAVEAEDPDRYPGGFDPDGSNALGVTPFFVDQSFSQNAYGTALFGNIQWWVSSLVELEVGLRYTSEKRKMQQTTSFVEANFDVPLVPHYTDSTDFDNLSWKLGVKYSPNEDFMYYGSISSGFKSGGYNGALVFDVNALRPFREETLTSYEVGMKSTLLHGRARMNAAIFYYSYDNMQLFTFDSVGGLPVQVLDNAGESTLYGLDADMDILLSENFEARFGLGLLHTKLDEYETTLTEGDLSGNDLVLSPKLSFNSRLRYQRMLASGITLSAQTDVSYQSKSYFTPDNNPLLSQESYWLWNAKVAYSNPGRSWDISLWIKNISDEEYYVETYDFSSNGWDLLLYGTPRTFGVDLEFHMQ